MFKDERIYLIECEVAVKNLQGNKTGEVKTLVSHGVGEDSMKTICLPTQSLHCFNPKFDNNGDPYI